MGEFKIVAMVEEIIYQNVENGFTICDMGNEDEGLFTAKGYMPFINEGERVELTGAWTSHPDYGEQFYVTEYMTLLPEDEKEILKYLSSGAVAGVGAATAKNLVAHFGAKTLHIMLNEPTRMTEIKGISPKRADKIFKSFSELQAVQAIVVFLQQFSISPSVALRVQKIFGSGAVEKLKQNPYLLTDMPDPVSFKVADKIAYFQGFEKNHPLRIKHGIKSFLMSAAYTGGHTYLPMDVLIKEASVRLRISRDDAENGIKELALIHDIYIEETPDGKRCIPAVFYAAENYVARRLVGMSATQPVYNIEDSNIEEIIENAGEESGITLAEEQRRAVETAVNSSCMVITGGPGTGKTTIIKAIISVMDKLSQSVVLTAPTGRAAKRMSEVTGCEAKTIHRLIGLKPEGHSTKTLHNENNPLEEDVIIADEASMIDISLASALLHAIKPGAKLILCGDANQLPSVGPGNFLRDVIESKAVPVISLNHIFRQARESLIVMNAHRINNGEMPELGAKDKDFFFIGERLSENTATKIVTLYKNRLPRRYGIDPVSKIQVLSPSKKGPAGTIMLNEYLQRIVNPPDILKAEYERGSVIFRVGDKVMQVKNDYDITWMRENGEVGQGIFNGDIGIIESISMRDKVMTILFDEDKEVEYPFQNTDKLELAYACTVHKSQGSEFPVVIIAVDSFAPMLLYRNILYTAITRAKDMVVLVGRGDIIGKMVKNDNNRRRYTALSGRMKTITDMTAKQLEFEEEETDNG